MIGETPTHAASDSELDSHISLSEVSEGVKVCRSCLLPPDSHDSVYCVKCGEKLVLIRRAKDPYLDTIVGEKYRVIKKIGQGGMGEVYLAENDTLGQKVAIKFLIKRFADDENIVLRFLNEARSYCRVAHPNAVTLLEFGQHDTGPLYIITEFIEGLSITDTLKSSGLMSLEQTIDVGIQIAEVLSAAHEQGVIHRDLKPDNIMLTPSKRGRFVVKVLDFGIAKIIDEDEGPATETGSVFGTPEFMSPEQARGVQVDGRADIYAFGIILCFLQTGKLPFKGGSKLAVLNQQINSPPPKLASLRPGMTFSEGMQDIMMKCLEKKADDRFQNAEAVLEALENLRIDDGAFLTSLSSVSSSSEVSEVSEVSDVVELKEHRMETVRLGDNKLSPAKLDSPFNDQPVNAELHSIEMWREAPTHPPSETVKKRSPIFWVAVIATLAVAAIAGLSLFSDSDESTQFDVVFNEGQALGVVAVAEGLLEEGKTTDVLSALQKTRGWETTVETKEKISQLSSTTEKAVALFATFQKDPCTHSEELAEISEISVGLAKQANLLKENCGSKKARPKKVSISKKERDQKAVRPKRPTNVESKTNKLKSQKSTVPVKKTERPRKVEVTDPVDKPTVEKKSQSSKKEKKKLDEQIEKNNSSKVLEGGEEVIEGLPPKVL